jgi:hypothetical protein
MSKSNTWENELLSLLFNNTNVANVGDATGLRGSSAPGSLYVGLHTADPAEGGDQTTSETNYGGYARAAVARSVAGWSVAVNQCSNNAEVAFPACTSGTSTVTHFSVGTAVSGAGKLLYKGQLTANLTVSTGITPKFAPNQLQVTED